MKTRTILIQGYPFRDPEILVSDCENDEELSGYCRSLIRNLSTMDEESVKPTPVVEGEEN